MSFAIVILVGGKGSRVSKLLNGLSKPELNITKNKKIIDFQLEKLMKLNKEIIFLSNYKFNSLNIFVEKKYKKKIKYKIIEETNPLGTAGALINLDKNKFENYLIIYGDLIFNLDFIKFYKFHFNKKSDCTLLVHPNNHSFDSDSVELDEKNKVVKLYNKKHKNKPNICLSGIQIINKNCLKLIKKNTFQDFSKNFLPNLIKMKKNIYAYNTREYVKDAGTPKRIGQIQKDIKTRKFINGSLNESIPAIFLDKDGVINKLDNKKHYQSSKNILPNVVDAIKKINDSKFLAVVISNQPAIAKGIITKKELDKDLSYLSIILGNKGVYLDRIYYCPHHPEKGFKSEITKLKIKCNCRKPNNGLFLKAVRDMNIDIKNSFMIGDQFSDYLAAKKTKLKFVGINLDFTNNEKIISKNNLLSAVNFILSSSN